MNIVRKTFLRITQLFITAKLNISFNSINLINSTSSPRTVRQVENLMVIDWYSFGTVFYYCSTKHTNC